MTIFSVSFSACIAGVNSWVDPDTDREFVFIFGGKTFLNDGEGSQTIERKGSNKSRMHAGGIRVYNI